MTAVATSIAAAVLCAVLQPTTPALAAPSASGIGIRLIDVPAATYDDPRARAYIVDHVQPGTSFHRRILIANTTASAQSVLAYAGAADVVDNAFTVADIGTGNELSSWVRVTPGRPDLPAHTDLTALVTITVPKNASAGERYAVVWAQVSAAATAQHNVGEINRVGIRIYLDVAPGGAPPSDFRIGTMAVDAGVPGGDGWPVVTADVDNTGQRTLDLAGTLTLTSVDGGLTAGPFTTDGALTLEAGHSGRARVVLNRTLPAGAWTVRLKLASGELTRTGQAVLTLGPGRATLTPTPPRRHNLSTLLLIGAIALVLALGGAVVVRARRVTA